MNKQESNTANAISGLSKEKLQKMLMKIESSEAPESKMGAMCYSPAFPPPDRAEYICPVCGKKTLHVNKPWIWDKEDAKPDLVEYWGNAELVEWKLPTARRLMTEIQKHTKAISLRENNFCNHCFPEKGTPNIGVAIHFDNGTKEVTDDISTNDLRLLLAFFNDDLEYEEIYFGGGKGFALQHKLPRLRELLGETEIPNSGK